MAGSSTATFTTVNGEIIGPDGKPFVARGINLYDSDMSDAQAILQDLSGINFVRLNVYSYQSPSAYETFIDTLTSRGIVVEIEDHTTSDGSDAGGGSGTAFTGQALTNELNWYSAMAKAYADNPYVWFGTDNEPPAAGLSTWEQETYNAIRSTGNENPIVLSVPGGGYPGGTESSYGLTASDYASMTNVIVDVHFYGWDSNYSTNQATVTAALDDLISGAQTIKSADGTVPVIIGEFGNSETNSQAAANWQQVLTAVEDSGYGFAAWNWDPGTTTDDITDNGTTLSTYGKQIASAIAAAASASQTAANASPNDTMVLAGSTAAVTDADGNAWTITSSGQVAVNGTAITGTANVSEIAYVGGTVWQETTSGNWYAMGEKNGVYTTVEGPTKTSPLPAPLTIAASTTSTTVSQSEISVVATSGNHMVFIKGSGDIISLSGGANVITDTGHGNTYILPAPGKGTDTFTSSVLYTSDTLDLKAALAATNWNGQASTLSKYVSVTDTSSGTNLAISTTSGGTGTVVATIEGASLNLSTVLAHAIT